jgi:hypothetical protein
VVVACDDTLDPVAASFWKDLMADAWAASSSSLKSG